ncbi:aminotransferase class I/II-fold pyridoxal phosphate-dependent enzyme [Wenxinia marina]|uniref:Aminotransferase n=1 Tax=Wenxinia marina DSM 24838 TaxID=1123501 RepID=A0A0D0PIF9_9RHOB|nr:aminotransferase class I/II-fold pyridoxal phosphate-dependent enzyme [Wenxinia marina]KIQ71151.1 Aspartate/tyrosine/aromatic aminotransferase [Wenxinia marina DSM 24838]GGL54440.1 aspartate aminotransferase [Wenxinia marina]
MFPTRFADLPDYAFPRLRKLLDVHDAGGEPIAMTIGEPQHPFPEWIGDILADSVEGFGAYPPNEGTPELLAAIAGWLTRRYSVVLGPDRLIVLNGTREGLYNAAMALCPETKNGARPAVLIPNPFYQVYAIGALSVGAEPVYVPATEATGFLPDYASLPKDVLDRTALAYVCSPANPQGSVADAAYWTELLTLAERHDFTILADECYSEIYRDAAPTGALEVARDMRADPERLVVFHSLSKRSNLPGLRAGFAAGGPQSIARMRQLRAYAGAPLPLPLQKVAEKVWADDGHVTENRALYAQKYREADRILKGVDGYRPPPAGFFLWLPVEDDEQAALKLWTETGVRVLPGGYLGRDTGDGNPGKKFIRVAMVAPTQEMARGLTLLRDCLYG